MRREVFARNTTGGALSQFVAGNIDLASVVTVYDGRISIQDAYNTASHTAEVVAASRLDNAGIDAARNGGVCGTPYDTTSVQEAAAVDAVFTYNMAVIPAILNG